MYRQVRRHNTYQYVYEPKLANRWRKVKHDTEFYEHLSPEMKASYKNYIDRVKQEQKDLRESFEQAKQLRSGVSVVGMFSFVITLTVIAIILERT